MKKYPFSGHSRPTHAPTDRVAGRSTRSTTALGRAAESQAVRYLKNQGYRVVGRNVRTDRGELDIVAWEAETLCFVEVKSRAHTDYGGARAAVDTAKQTRVWRAAEAYLAGTEAGWNHPPECRFDVVAMHQRGPEEWTIELFRDAF